ncbi:hypothetical protein PAMP_008838 [Pampus punctatissimus]
MKEQQTPVEEKKQHNVGFQTMTKSLRFTDSLEEDMGKQREEEEEEEVHVQRGDLKHNKYVEPKDRLQQ